MAATPSLRPSAAPLRSVGIKSEVLLRAARPDLFRLNAFRVTGLPVDATAQQVSRRVDKLRMTEKFGGAAGRSRGALPLDPPPDTDRLRMALQRLHDPETRLVDEFFWFWPHDLDDTRDEALSALSQGDEGRAVKVWTEMEARQSVSNVSMHNLAVLAHLKVLDSEQGPRTTELNAKELSGRGDMWRAAFRRWKVLMEDEAFWSRLTARIQRLDDPRLTTGTARRMRESLPLALLSINAQLALRAAQADNVPEAKGQLAVMQGSGFDTEVVSESLHCAIEPLRERIKTMCHGAQQDVSSDSAKGASVTRRLLEQSKPLLAVIDCLLPAGDPLREGAHDEVALQSLSCQVVFGNKTEDWRASVELLEQVLPIAVSASARVRIEENLRIVRENKKMGACFFCEEQPKDKSAEIEVKVHGNVQTFSVGYNTTRTTWNHRTITVPRCKSCAEAHRQRSKSQGVGFGVTVLSLAVYLLALTVISDLVSEGPALLAYLAGVAIALVIPGMMAGAIGWLRMQSPAQSASIAADGKVERSVLSLSGAAHGVKPESAKFAFPAIQERKSAGWKLGGDPPGTIIPSSGPPHQPLLTKWGFLRRQILSGRNVYVRLWAPALLVLLLLPILTGVSMGGVSATSFLLQMGLISPKAAFVRLAGELDGTSESALAAINAMTQALPGSGIDSATSVPALAKAVGNSDARVSIAAAEYLGRMGSGAQAASSALEKAVQDQREDVATAATEALNRVDPEASTRSAITGLTSTSVQVRRRAAMRLANIGPEAKGSVPVLLRTLEDSDADVRNLVSVALTKVAPDMIVPRLIAQLVDASWRIRQNAAQQLGNLGRGAAVALSALRAATRDSDPDVRRAATEALRKVGEPGVKQVMAQMKDSNSPAQVNKAGRDQKVAAQLAKAQQLWRNGQPEEALQACDAALSLDPNSEEAASLRQKYSKAIAILNGGKQ
jgi:HEAT repeat protein